MGKITFRDRSFCFTGKMADLKRTQAEREARSRGALSQGVVNERLDYLVVGSIPATGWKHGSYGTKIERARELAPHNGGRPQLVSESDFMEALALVPANNSGEIDVKVGVFTYKFVAASHEAFDYEGFESVLERLSEQEEFHVTTRANWVVADRELYGNGAFAGVPDSYVIVEARFVKQLTLEAESHGVADAISRSFEALEGVDGAVNWFERVEGSADYVRLLRQVPKSLRIPDLARAGPPTRSPPSRCRPS